MQTTQSISKQLTLIMAVACGVAVANLYYAQPLLNSIAATFHIGEAVAGSIVTMTQAGYAAGLLLLVPVGDIVNRRKLVLTVLALSPIALLAAGLAPGIGTLLAASLAIGVASVVAQVLIPFAASLASDQERGRVVGTVVSGLLIGILLARTFSGLIAGLWQWRAVFYLAAVAMVLLTLVLYKTLPADAPRPHMPYAAVMRSVGHLLRTEPVLQLRSLLGALGFACFSLFWTTVTFVLAGPPYHYGSTVIGLFGLVGAAGAAAANLAGGLADKGRTRPATGALTFLLALSFLPLWLGRHSLAAMIVGILLLDVAVQGLHVLNQSENYRIAPEARSRVNGAYMTSYFVGGAIGSAVGASLYESGGWLAVCRLGVALGTAAFAVWAWDLARMRRRRSAAAE